MYIVSEVCSEWTRKKLFVYVFQYAVQSTTPHTGYMIVLLSYIYKCVFAPSTSHSFASKDCISASSFPPAVILVLSLITAGAILSYVPLPRLYNLLNHPAVINKHIIHPQFLHIALFTVYIYISLSLLMPLLLR